MEYMSPKPPKMRNPPNINESSKYLLEIAKKVINNPIDPKIKKINRFK